MKDQLSIDRSYESEPYKMTGDSLRQDGIPQGELLEAFLPNSTVYPDVHHDYWIYIPAQYRKSEPAALMIFLDGLSYVNGANAAIVLDNLIAKGNLPITVALFVDPGDKGPGIPIYGGNDNRSVEYDSIDDTYARFLESDLLPHASQVCSITDDPDLRLICGVSSGGLAAFATAWNRPDLFRKVISHSGSFTAIRGGEIFPTLIRREPKKPLRIWLSVGKKDLDVVFGNWRIANEYMASSLEYRGYDYQFHLSEGSHNLQFPASVLPETLRWMFRDYKNRK